MYEYIRSTEAGRRRAGVEAAKAEERALRAIQQRVARGEETADDLQRLGELLARSQRTLEALIQNREAALDRFAVRMIGRAPFHPDDAVECLKLCTRHPHSWQWLTEALPSEFPVEGE